MPQCFTVLMFYVAMCACRWKKSYETNDKTFIDMPLFLIWAIDDLCQRHFSQYFHFKNQSSVKLIKNTLLKCLYIWIHGMKIVVHSDCNVSNIRFNRQWGFIIVFTLCLNHIELELVQQLITNWLWYWFALSIIESC